MLSWRRQPHWTIHGHDWILCPERPATPIHNHPMWLTYSSSCWKHTVKHITAKCHTNNQVNSKPEIPQKVNFYYISDITFMYAMHIKQKDFPWAEYTCPRDMKASFSLKLYFWYELSQYSAVKVEGNNWSLLTQLPWGTGAFPVGAHLWRWSPFSRTVPSLLPHSVPQWQTQAHHAWSALKHIHTRALTSMVMLVQP